MRLVPLILLAIVPRAAWAEPAAPATPEPRELVARADGLFGSGEWAAAAAAYETALQFSPADGESRYLQGLAYQRLGDWERAAAAYRRAADYRPRRGSALYRLAGALAHLGQADRSVVLLRQAIEAGFLQTAWLATDPALEPLRDRPDFRELLRDQFGSWYTEPAPTAPTTAAQKKTGISHLTSTIRRVHPNPYRVRTPDEWERRTATALSNVESMSEAEYLVELMGLASMAGDVHTSVFPDRDGTLMRTALPVQFWKFRDSLRIRAAAEPRQAIAGAEVLAIGGVPVREFWPRLLERFPTENEWMSAYTVQFLLRFPDFLEAVGLGDDGGTVLGLRLTEGEEKDLLLRGREFGGYRAELRRTLGFRAPDDWTEAHDGSSTPLWLSARDRAYWFEEIPDKGAIYFQFNAAGEDSSKPWSVFLEELANAVRESEAKRLIIDLRHNGGGWDYMAYDLVDRLRSIPELAGPGHVVVLIGRLVQSAGVTIATVLERETDALFVGEPVGAHPNFFNGPWGNHPPLALPGTRIRFRVSTLQHQFSDPLDERRFIAPDRRVVLPFDDYVRGRDPALEVALSISTPEAARLLQDPGGRPIERYFRWNRPSQQEAFPDSPRTVP